MQNECGVDIFINPLIDQRMYLIELENSAIIVDPFESDDLYKSLDKKNISEILVLITHEHYDHISGVNALQERYSIVVVASELCKKNIEDPEKNNTKQFPLLFLHDKHLYDAIKNKLRDPYFCVINKYFSREIKINWYGIKIIGKWLGGHSIGSSVYLINNRLLFSGDNLLGNDMEKMSYDFDDVQFNKIVLPYFKTLDSNIYVLPGHGEILKLEEFLREFDKERDL